MSVTTATMPATVRLSALGRARAALDAVPASAAGTAGGVFNTSRQVGGALAVAVFGSLLADPGSFLPGLRLSPLLAAAVTAAAAAAALLLRTHPEETS